jgi:tRNA modification GTPase
MVKDRVATYRRFRAPDGSLLDSGLVSCQAQQLYPVRIPPIPCFMAGAVVAGLEAIAGNDGVRHAGRGVHGGPF